MDKFRWGKGFIFGTILLKTGTRSAGGSSDITLVAGDVKISKDGATWSDITTLPSFAPSPRVTISFSDTECQCQSLMVRFKDQDVGSETFDEQTLIFQAEDLRLGRIQYPSPANFVERSGILSGAISKTSTPGYGAIYTQSDSATQYDFDTKLLMGAYLSDDTTGYGFQILGGYFFDDATDTTLSAFGICLDSNKFGIVEAGTTRISTSWTGIGATSEAGHGSGWTFVVMKSPYSYPAAAALSIHINPNVMLGIQLNDRENLGLRTLDVNNIDGTAVTFTGGACGGNGLRLVGASVFGSGLSTSGKYGVRAESDDSDGSGIYAKGNGTGHGINAVGGDTSGSGINALGSGTGSGILTTGGDSGHGIDAEGGTTTGDGIKAQGNVLGFSGSCGIRSTGFYGMNLTGSGGAASSGLMASGERSGIEANGGTNYGMELIGGTVSPGGAGLYARGGTYSGGASNCGIEAIGLRGAPGIKAYAEGVGAGIQATGGTDGSGINAIGGLTSGHAIYALARGSAADGFRALGSVSGNGINALGSNSGGGSGIRSAAQSSNASGFQCVKNGTGKDIDADEIDNLFTLSTLVDTVSVGNIFQRMLAMTSGKFALNTPSTGDITFYKQNSTDVAFVVNVTDTERTRVSAE